MKQTKLSGITLSIKRIAHTHVTTTFSMPHIIEESETCFDLNRVEKKAIPPVKKNAHDVVMVIPIYVETAFPPLKPVNNGKMLPKRAPTHAIQ